MGGIDAVYSLSADASELERCSAAFAQAKELLGRSESDPTLWRQAEAEHGHTLRLHAALLEERPDAADGSRTSAIALLREAATRFAAAADVVACGDATIASARCAAVST